MQKKSLSPPARREFIFERKDFMKFKVVGKSLILTDYSHKITEGENSFDIVEIAVPKKHDDCDISNLSFRFSEISEDGEKSAVQILRHEKCDEKYIYLKGTITSDFSSITGKVIFMLTGVNGENVVAKFQSDPFTVNDDISLASLPNETTAEQLLNQAQLEVQKAIDAANRAEKASQTPAPAEIYPATSTRLGGVLSGNDISVSDNGTVTVNSVKGKTLGKSVPADALFTDTVYTLPKATTDTIGGIKVDGNTITASIDGTISAKEVQNLAMQIAHHNNFLIYDNAEKPSVMVAIPKFYLDEVIDGASHTVHPAFIINGVEQDVIYISKYQNIVENGLAYSLPMKKPQVNINFETAYNCCKAKGEGWHLMTNAEWAAIALWCKKNGTVPKGNNNYGKDISESGLPQQAVPATYNSNRKINITLTGSGPSSWFHNETFSGISDLNGNIWEWCSGFRIVNGEFQILENNNAADWNNSVSADSTLWKTILQNGSLSKPNAENALRYTDFEGTTFSRIKSNAEANSGGANLAISLALIPAFGAASSDYGDDEVWLSLSDERMLMRGNCFSNGSNSGIFSILINSKRLGMFPNVGFRCAYYGSL